MAEGDADDDGQPAISTRDVENSATGVNRSRWDLTAETGR
jgi:hypothetical protein